MTGGLVVDFMGVEKTFGFFMGMGPMGFSLGEKRSFQYLALNSLYIDGARPKIEPDFL